MPTPRDRWWAIPLALAVVVFAIGLGHEFVLDDRPAILDNPVVRGDVPWWEAFGRTFWGQPLEVPPPSYRPLPVLSFVVDRALFGLSAPAFHAVSLGWYVLAVLLVERAARLWCTPRASVLAASLFATAPIHAEIVSSLVGRADLMACVGVLAAVLALGPSVRTTGDRRPVGVARLALAALAYGFALASKESAALLPLAVAVMVEFGVPRRRRSLGDAWAQWRGPVVLAAVGGGYLALRASLFEQAVGGYPIADDVVVDASFSERIAYGLELLTRYAGLLASPFDLCTGRKYAEVYLPRTWGDPLVLGGLLCVVAIGLAAVRAWRRREVPMLLVAFVLWWVFSSIPWSVPEAMADRFLALPSIFIAIALARALAGWARHSRSRWALVSLVVVLQGVLAGFHASRWSDSATLMRHAVLACPRSAHNQFRYAMQLAERGRHDDAVWHFAVASEIRRAFPRAWEHPAPDAMATIEASDRIARMHALLAVDLPEAVWRRALATYLLGLGLRHEAQRVVDSSPVDLAAPSP